jgi:flagellar assembly protein FliH
LPNSNFLKGNYIRDNGQRIIDYNDLISTKIETLRKQAQEGQVHAGFISGLSAQAVESLIGDADENADTDTNASIDALLTDVNSGTSTGEEELAGLAQETLSQAHEKADAMLESARQEAQQIQEDAKKQGYDSGYEQGKNNGYEEGLKAAKAEYESRLKELEEERQRLKADFDAQYAEVQPKIVGTILDVIEKVTGIVYENNRDILIHLINRVLNEIEASNEYMIRVSKADYDFLVSRQSKLYAASAKDMNIDILEDKDLAEGQCVIETDGGIFDCSLDVQMEQLAGDIRLLAGV